LLLRILPGKGEPDEFIPVHPGHQHALNFPAHHRFPVLKPQGGAHTGQYEAQKEKDAGDSAVQFDAVSGKYHKNKAEA
jgi:hypothetical protein